MLREPKSTVELCASLCQFSRAHDNFAVLFYDFLRAEFVIDVDCLMGEANTFINRRNGEFDEQRRRPAALQCRSLLAWL